MGEEVRESEEKLDSLKRELDQLKAVVGSRIQKEKFNHTLSLKNRDAVIEFEYSTNSRLIWHMLDLENW